MKTIKHKGLILELYDSIDVMPYRKYQEYNMMCLLDASIGADLNSVSNHYKTIGKLLNNKDKAIIELNNLNQNLHFIIQNISPELKSFACLVYSINGKNVSYKSSEEIEKIINTLPVGLIQKTLNWFKKKINEELEIYFPEKMKNNSSNDAFHTLKKRTLLILDEILGTKRTKELRELEELVYNRYKPMVFSGSNGLEVQSIKAFNEMCLLMEKYVKNPKEMTVLMFYQALDVINKKNKNGKSNINE